MTLIILSTSLFNNIVWNYLSLLFELYIDFLTKITGSSSGFGAFSRRSYGWNEAGYVVIAKNSLVWNLGRWGHENRKENAGESDISSNQFDLWILSLSMSQYSCKIVQMCRMWADI